jgi:uncharacterized protein YcbX
MKRKMRAKIDCLSHYPIKGLSGCDLADVILAPQQGFPADRIFGFARPNSGFDPAHPLPLAKENFHVLARDQRLALLSTDYDVTTSILSIKGLDQSREFDLSQKAECHDAATFVQEFLGLPEDQVPTLFGAFPHRFTDVSVTSAQLMNAVSLVSQSSVDALSQTINAPVDAARFRANIVFSGMPAFRELDLLGRTLEIGEVQFRVLKRTRRCAATEVNLKTGERDIKIPYLLRKHFGHMDMGIYAEVIRGGKISIDDPVTVH